MSITKKQCDHELIEESCIFCKLSLCDDEIRNKLKALFSVNAIVSELYADRGEDEKTEHPCKKIMDIIARS